MSALLLAERDARSKSPQTSPESLLRLMVEALCDHPQDVQIEINVSDSFASFVVHLNPSDVSKVLGAGGSHAFALRTLFTAVYGRLGKKMSLLVVDPKRRR